MSNRDKVTLLIALMIGTAVALAACGSESDEAGFAKINPGSKTYSIGDFESVGFKVVKEYDVEGLTGATSALHGFLKVSGLTPQSYELRFYASHDEAVQVGTSFAELVTGDDATFIASEMVWSEAVKEEKEPLFEGGGQTSFYSDYAIYGNVVMLCEGDWSEQSLEVCERLEAALDGTLSS